MTANVRLGYTVVNKTLNLSSARQLRRRRNGTLPTESACMLQFERNVQALSKIIGWNITTDVGCFRIGEDLLPRAIDFNYGDLIKRWRVKLADIGMLANESKQLLTFHSTNLYFGTDKEEVWKSTLDRLTYFSMMLDIMEVEYGFIVCHLGPNYINDDQSVITDRIIKRLKNLPDSIRNRICLENDLSWSAAFTYFITKQTDTVFVYDWHHHRCYDALYPRLIEDWIFDRTNIELVLRKTKASWARKTQCPAKIHISSYTNKEQMMQHAEYVGYEDYARLRVDLNNVGGDFNVMIEAKNTDLAVMRIHDMLKVKLPNWKKFNKAGFYV